MDKKTFLSAFRALDHKLKTPAKLLIGGGAALLLAYDIPLGTMDVDGLPFQTETTFEELDPLIKEVARELKISPHWFSGYFSTFTYTVPSDFKDRLANVFKGKKLEVVAFGLEDLLIMKCFSGRGKDVGHAKAIIKKGVNLDIVEGQMQKLYDKGVPGASEAFDFLDDIKEQMGK